MMMRCHTDTCPAAVKSPCVQKPSGSPPALEVRRTLLNGETALLDLRQMREADLLSVDAGISSFDLMTNAASLLAGLRVHC